MKARVLAQLPDLRVHATASLTHQKAEQPDTRLAPERGVLLVPGSLAVREGEHRAPLGDRFVDLLHVFEDLRQQPVRLDALGFERLRPSCLRDRVDAEIVFQQHLRQSQMATHAVGARARAARPRSRALRASGRPETVIRRGR